jgi:hypothetical protein
MVNNPRRARFEERSRTDTYVGHGDHRGKAARLRLVSDTEPLRTI